MRSFFTFTIAGLILTACSQAVPSATSTPLPSLTPTTNATATPTPPPTFTPIPPLAPEILASAQEIFGKDLKVNPDGSVLDPATGQNIPGFTIRLAEDGKSWQWQRVDGELTLSGGQDDIRLFGNGGLGTDGWKYENGKWVEVEIKEYPICAPKDFLSNPIDVNDFYDGTFDAWAATQAKPFTAEQLDMRPWVVTGRGTLFPDPTIDRVPGTITMHKDITCGVVEMDGIRYLMLPIELPDPSDPTNPDKNIRVNGFGLTNYIKNGQIGTELPGGIMKSVIDIWMDKMAVLPIVTDYHWPGTSVSIPLAEKTWEVIGEEKMADIFKRVRNGDIAALRELNGMPVMVEVMDSPWFK